MMKRRTKMMKILALSAMVAAAAMAPFAAKPAEAAEPVRLKKRSYWGEVWHRLKKNPVSIICLVFLVVLLGLWALLSI